MMSKFIWDADGNKINVSMIKMFFIQEVRDKYRVNALMHDKFDVYLISEHSSKQDAKNEIDELTMSDFESIRPIVDNILDTITLSLHGPMEH